MIQGGEGEGLDLSVHSFARALPLPAVMYCRSIPLLWGALRCVRDEKRREKKEAAKYEKLLCAESVSEAALYICGTEASQTTETDAPSLKIRGGHALFFVGRSCTQAIQHRHTVEYLG
ncbi:unnamed protein product, partial [Discosporangium mesarthrocarpum]